MSTIGEGTTVLVTGASSGIGAELAERLAARGATVGLVARRAERLAAVLERCREHVPACRSWVADLADLDRAEAVALEAWEAFGGLDVVVNNAAIPKRRNVRDLTPAEVEELMRTNYLSPVRITLALLPRFAERDRGTFVFVSSLAGRVGVPNEAAYAASKAALCGWAESMRIDLDGTGVAVRLVIPGAIDTEIWDLPGNEAPLYAGDKEPPGDVADAIIEAVEGNDFERYVPDLKAIVEFKTGDIDAFLAGAADMARQATEQGGWAWGAPAG